MKLDFRRRTFKLAVGLLLAVTFGFVGVWGANLTMMTDSGGNMPKCPFGVETGNICAMTVSAHMSYWQQLFLSVPGKNAVQIVLGIFMILGILLTIKCLSDLTRPAFIFQGVPRTGPPENFHYLYQDIGSGIVHKRE